MTSDPRATDGQASLEWLAVVVLVSVLLGFGAALAEARFLGRHVTREMARALCLVGAGDCARDREPCVVASERGAQSLTMDLFIVRLGGGTSALVQRRSDGNYAVTAGSERTFGVEAGPAFGAGLDVAGIELAVGGQLQASMIGRRGGGRTWIVPSPAAAEAVLDDLGGAGPPAVSYGDGDLVSSLGLKLGADALVHVGVARGTLSFDRHAGSQIDHRTGHRTIYVRSSWGAGGAVAGVLGLSRGGVPETYAVELDASGRPLDLQVVGAGRFDGSQDLPGVLQPVAGMLRTGAAHDRIYEVTTHLDLTDAGNLAAARGLLDALARRDRRPGAPPAAAVALRRRIDERGTVEARVLAHRATGDDVGAHGALGGRFGGAVHVEHEEQRLLAAASRGLDGQWVPRDDCASRA